MGHLMCSKEGRKMSLTKLFNRILWHNNTTPALNEDNLNAMSKGLDDVDDRVIELAGTIMEDVPVIQEYLSQAEELVDQMEELSKNPPYIGANGNWYVWDTESGAYVDSNVDASITVAIADITMLAPTATPYVTNTGTNTDPIFHLYIPRGIGIASIQKTGTSGLVDTYTITYSDGYTDTFTVANGKTAYQYAVDGGYSGTEADFYADLANFEQWKDDAEQGASDAEAYAKGTRSGTAVDSSDPAYHNNAQYFAGLSDTSAQASAGSATSSAGSASDSEAYGAGTRNGVPVDSSDPAYHNNAPYYAEQAAAQTLGGLTDVDIDVSTLAEGHIIAFNATTNKWENTPIKAAVIQNVPSQSGTLTYDGTSQSPSWSNYNSNIMTIGGETSGTNAGTYTATFTPAVGYCWDDYSTGPKSVTWSIGQAVGAVTLSKVSVTLNTSTLLDTITASNATGTLSVASSDTSVATASISGSTITINSVNNTTGSATITVSVAASGDGNYTAATKTISVSAQFKPIVKPWATATDAELAEIIQAYYDGVLTRSDIEAVWSIGDERSVSLSAMQHMPQTTIYPDHVAQTIKMVIMNFGGKKLSSDHATDVLAIIGQKNGLANGTTKEDGGLNSARTNYGGWDSCDRRTWCNETYRAAIPTDFRALFKQFDNKSNAGNKSTTIITSSDYFALAARVEVDGTTTAIYVDEGTQFDYYKTAANRIKYIGENGGAEDFWWTRTAYSVNTDNFHAVNKEGNAQYAYEARVASAIAPFGCI